jgi:hypothetical protein
MHAIVYVYWRTSSTRHTSSPAPPAAFLLLLQGASDARSADGLREIAIIDDASGV